MSGRFNENTRVQVPAALHLCRLGYTYLDSIDEDDYEPNTNILVKVFREAVARLNPDITEDRVNALLSELVQAATGNGVCPRVGSWHGVPMPGFRLISSSSTAHLQLIYLSLLCGNI